MLFFKTIIIAIKIMTTITMSNDNDDKYCCSEKPTVKTKSMQFSSTCINRFLHKMVISTNLGFDLGSYKQVLNFRREKYYNL